MPQNPQKIQTIISQTLSPVLDFGWKNNTPGGLHGGGGCCPAHLKPLPLDINATQKPPSEEESLAKKAKDSPLTVRPKYLAAIPFGSYFNPPPAQNKARQYSSSVLFQHIGQHLQRITLPLLPNHIGRVDTLCRGSGDRQRGTRSVGRSCA